MPHEPHSFFWGFARTDKQRCQTARRFSTHDDNYSSRPGTRNSPCCAWRLSFDAAVTETGCTAASGASTVHRSLSTAQTQRWSRSRLAPNSLIAGDSAPQAPNPDTLAGQMGMRPDDLAAAIAQWVNVTRADIVAAKGNLLERMTDQLEIEAEAKRWATIAAGEWPKQFELTEDVDDASVARLARHIVAHLASIGAALELVATGQAFPVGNAYRSWSFTLTVNERGHGGGVSWPDFVASFPERIGPPRWYDAPSDLFDADLYLRRLPTSLHPAVASALRSALACFRQELHLPCAAMLGAAMEGAWLEAGTALSKRFASSLCVSPWLSLLE